MVAKRFTFAMPVRLYACISAAPTGRISVKYGIGNSTQICREIADLVNSG